MCALPSQVSLMLGIQRDISYASCQLLLQTFCWPYNHTEKSFAKGHLLIGYQPFKDPPNTSLVQPLNTLVPFQGDLNTITVGGVSLQGVSVGGQETCIIIPSMKLAFDVGRCPQRAVFQENVLISHAHMDHIVSDSFQQACLS